MTNKDEVGSAGTVSQDDAANAGADSPHLNEGEQAQAADHSTPHALIIHEVVREEGETALARSTWALTWSALAAGLSMGFSFVTMAVIRAGLPNTPSAALIDSFGYAIGFVIVVMGKQQLFTESTLTVILPVLVRRDVRTFLAALRVWAIVLPVNLIGTALFAGILNVPGLLEAPVVAAMQSLAIDTVSYSFGITFSKALLAGWLIALMVWLLPSARNARVLIIILITYVVSVTKLSHIIAGSVECLFSVFRGQTSLLDYAWRFLIPTLLGNVAGGMMLVGLLNHATVSPEIRESK